MLDLQPSALQAGYLLQLQMRRVLLRQMHPIMEAKRWLLPKLQRMTRIWRASQKSSKSPQFDQSHLQMRRKYELRDVVELPLLGLYLEGGEMSSRLWIRNPKLDLGPKSLPSLLILNDVVREMFDLS